MAKNTKQSAGTPALAALAKAGIAHHVHAYEHDATAHERGLGYGVEAAQALGIDAAKVYKTLVAEVDGRMTVAIVPVLQSLDLKALAAAVGGKKAEMAPVAAAERTTGYVAGGISPIGARKALPTVLDSSARTHDTVLVSAGRRGLDVELSPADLILATRASVAAIAK